MRRTIITALFLFGCCAHAQTREIISTEYAFPDTHRAKTYFIDWLASEVLGRSQGKLKLSSQSTQIPDESAWQRLVSGKADLVFGTHEDAADFFPRTLLSGLGGELEAPYDTTERLWYESRQSLKQEYESVKLLSLCTASSAGLASLRPVRTYEDFKGLRIVSFNAFANPVIRSMGAIPVNLPDNEISQAFANGSVDAVYANFAALKAVANQKNGTLYFTTNIPVQTRQFFLAMNIDAYEKLSRTGKTVIDSLSEVDSWMNCAETFLATEEEIMQTIENGRFPEMEQIILAPVEREKLNSAVNRGLKTIYGNIRAQGVYDHDDIYKVLNLR